MMTNSNGGGGGVDDGGNDIEIKHALSCVCRHTFSPSACFPNGQCPLCGRSTE